MFQKTVEIWLTENHVREQDAALASDFQSYYLEVPKGGAYFTRGYLQFNNSLRSVCAADPSGIDPRLRAADVHKYIDLMLKKFPSEERMKKITLRNLYPNYPQ